MVNRPFWLSRIEAAWKSPRILWLRGVRRAGKTLLCQSIPGAEYFDCESPRERRAMDDPEGFLERLKGKRVVLDEIHRLRDPAELLKLAADHFPSVRVVATGSSTLEASAKFRDTLTGRRAQLWLTPMNTADLAAFSPDSLNRRLLRGGLPPFFLAEAFPDLDFQDWLDSFWAKDVQELFRLEKRAPFSRFAELLFAQSGGIFEAQRFAAPCEISRQTVSNYLAALEATMTAYVIRPFSSHRPTEIVAAPKVYAFDTGFACYFKGWTSLRDEDLGHMWEHYVLNELLSLAQRVPNYWRDKQGREVDFVLPARGKPPLAIECKWKASAFDPAAIIAFRKIYPGGENLVVCQDVAKEFSRVEGGVTLRFVGLAGLTGALGA